MSFFFDAVGVAGKVPFFGTPKANAWAENKEDKTIAGSVRRAETPFSGNAAIPSDSRITKHKEYK